jgi:hypothetical protein
VHLPWEGAEDAQLDGLDLLVVLARLEGRQKRQNEGGGGELDTGGGALRRRCRAAAARVREAAGARARGAHVGFKGRGQRWPGHARQGLGGALAGHGGLGLWPVAGWAPPGQTAGPERVGSGPRARPNPVG